MYSIISNHLAITLHYPLYWHCTNSPDKYNCVNSNWVEGHSVKKLSDDIMFSWHIAIRYTCYPTCFDFIRLHPFFNWPWQGTTTHMWGYRWFWWFFSRLQNFLMLPLLCHMGLGYLAVSHMREEDPMTLPPRPLPPKVSCLSKLPSLRCFVPCSPWILTPFSPSYALLFSLYWKIPPHS